jgi:hypothetical protein
MDRGADDFEVFCRARRVGTDWVGRVKSRNRLVREGSGRQRPLSDVLAGAAVAGCYTLDLRARPRQPARRARLEVSFAPVTTPVPRHPAASLTALGPQPIPQWVVWARERTPPPTVKEPIDWVLLTSLPVGDLGAAMEVIGYYEKRWLIEEWHKALKTGCQVEGRQLHTSHRLEALTGLLSVVAVRLLQMKEVGRRPPRPGSPRGLDDPRLLPGPGGPGRLPGPQGRRRARLGHDLAGLGRLALDAPGRSTLGTTIHLVSACCG